MGKQYDAIVIGAGHNGLTAAAYLAKAGLKVGVLEKNNFIGGATNTIECTLPGFKHDVGGIIHHIIRENPMLRNDELGLHRKFGLKYVQPEINTVNLFDDGTSMVLHKSVEETCKQIAQWSEEDAESYARFIDYTMPMMPLINQGMFNPPPDFGAMMNQLDKSPVGRELIRIMMMSIWDIAHQWFKHPKTLMHVLKAPTEPMVGMEEKGTGAYLVVVITGNHVEGGGASLAVGGSGMLAKALTDCIESYGGEVLTNQEVVKITTSGGRATGVVTAEGEEYTAKHSIIANIDARIVINRWLGEDAVSSNLRAKVDRIQNASFSGMMIAAALDEAPRYKASDTAHKATYVEPLPTDINAFRSMFDDLRYGRLPKKEAMAPMVVVPTEHDPSRAPEGKHVLYLWHYCPYELADGGKEKWASIKEGFADTVQDRYFSFTTNMTKEKVLKRTVFSPVDLENFNNNLYQGNIVGIGAFMNQMYSYRPIPELGHYRTPVEGLYLSGMHTHPGGSIIGAGRAQVQVVLEDLGIDFDDVIS